MQTEEHLPDSFNIVSVENETMPEASFIGGDTFPQGVNAIIEKTADDLQNKPTDVVPPHTFMPTSHVQGTMLTVLQPKIMASKTQTDVSKHEICSQEEN